MKDTVLIIGGGIAGIQAALDLGSGLVRCRVNCVSNLDTSWPFRNVFFCN